MEVERSVNDLMHTNQVIDYILLILKANRPHPAFFSYWVNVVKLSELDRLPEAPQVWGGSGG